MQARLPSSLLVIILFTLSGHAGESGKTLAPNTWVKVSENAVGPRFSPALVWSKEAKRFLIIGGRISHSFRGERPWDVQSFDVKDRKWRNQLPEGAKKLGGETGNVKDPGYKSPWFVMKDKLGMNRPNRRHMVMHNMYAMPSWQSAFIGVACGRTLKYDPAARVWKDLKPQVSVLRESSSFKGTLNWAAVCADPVNRELMLFGGCGVETKRADMGTWVYSTEKNTWRDLKLEKQPPQRALSPMAYDPATKKIVLFGGDRLDQLYADTWVYDTKTRKWEEKKPAISPAPRFGHALLYLPKSKKIVLLGGKTYRSSTGYGATLYKPLPFEAWTYDVAANKWVFVKRWEKGQGPAMAGHRGGGVDSAAVAAVSDQDLVLLLGVGTAKRSPHSSWLCKLDATVSDAAGTAKYGVKPGTLGFRTGPFDPEYYTKDVPPPNPAAQAAFLKNLPANQFVSVKAPRWPKNRQGGGWSTVALDTDRDQILHLGGGHSSYFGNDVAHYDIKTGRWSIAARPMFALHYNYDLSGPGPFAFNNGPWGGHNYHAYAYDPTIKRLVYMKYFTNFYDPEKRKWIFEERLKTPFKISKYITYLRLTSKGLIAWTHVGHQRTGMFRLEQGKKWVKLPLTGKLPVTVCDGSAADYDSKRDRLLMTTSTRVKGKSWRDPVPQGQVWSYDFKTGEAKALDPVNKGALKTGRFAREAVYLPKSDMLMLGYLLKVDGKLVVPFYDCAKNKWFTAEMPGAEGFINRKGRAGSSVDLGLIYDAKRDLVWGTLCALRGDGHLRVLRIDRKSLKLIELK
jgi:Galactose oxidase, central domain